MTYLKHHLTFSKQCVPLQFGYRAAHGANICAAKRPSAGQRGDPGPPPAAHTRAGSRPHGGRCSPWVLPGGPSPELPVGHRGGQQLRPAHPRATPGAAAGRQPAFRKRAWPAGDGAHGSRWRPLHTGPRRPGPRRTVTGRSRLPAGDRAHPAARHVSTAPHMTAVT